MDYYNYKTASDKRLTLLGMSGVGKTYLANLLRQTGSWFHYSGDYRIGSRYLDEPILDNIKMMMMGDDFLRPLLMSDAIYINNNIAFNNLLPISSFLGQLGNPEQGALPFDEFMRRQGLHFRAEASAMADVTDFIHKAKVIYGYNHFINDAGGSLCELDEATIVSLAKQTLLLYIKTSPKHQKLLIARALANPKPLYYHPDFLAKQLKTYLSKNQLDFVAQVDPNDFDSWIFPRLVSHRLPRYEYLANKYGTTISSDDLYHCKTATDFFELLDRNL